MSPLRIISITGLLLSLLQPPLAAGEKKGDWARRADEIKDKLDAELPSLDKLYKHLHAHPELAFQEEKSAALMAKELEGLGFKVTTKVGVTGVVGVFDNGPGPTVLVRTDMDALPITEATGLPYASKVRVRDKEGNDTGVMHACGHDMHMTCWVGVARTLVHMKKHWQGKLVFIGQPAEEVGGGARRMIEDGLFKRFPRPDYCLGLHCDARQPVGHVSYSEGLLMANVDTIDITVRGKGGHGSAPHTTIDPIVLAARMILDFQTIVSREISPTESAVLTVGSIHGGSKHNIIPNDVKLQITVRSFKDSVRKQVLEAIHRIAKAAAQGARAPEPIIRVELDFFTPAVYNNADLAKKTAVSFREVLGKDRVHLMEPIMGGEDFSRYGLEGIPIFFYFIGTSDPAKLELARKGEGTVAGPHSDMYFPLPEPSIRTGVTSMTTAVLNLLGRRKGD